MEFKFSGGQWAARCVHCRIRCSAVVLIAGTSPFALHLIFGTRLPILLTVTAMLTGTLVMIGIGLRRYRPAHPLPWSVLSVSAVLFTAGTVLRDSNDTPIDHVLICVGYVGIGLAALLWLRPHRERADVDTLLDSGLIGLGALLASWTFLISPILRAHSDSLSTVTAAICPLLDALLLTLIAHSVATTIRTVPAQRLLHIGLLTVLLGNLGHSLAAAGTPLAGREWSLVPLLVSLPAMGAAALHPTMTMLGEPRPIHPHHSRQRASLIAVVLIVASLVPVVGSRLGVLDRVVVSSLLALLLIGVLARSERAIVRSARSEQRAQYQADHDMLTGLLNRSALLGTPHRNRERWDGRALCLLFIDLDGFKTVNDSYGHAVGDELIANAGTRIRRAVRHDDIVARYGGDEFVVLAPLERQDAAALAERLLRAFLTPFRLSAGDIPITASIGLACGTLRNPGITIYDLIQNADAAMYRAKERGLGYMFHDDIRGARAADAKSVRRPVRRRETAV